MFSLAFTGLAILMAYTFSGIFSNGNVAVLDDLRRKRSGRGRLIASIQGFGFAFVGEYEFCDSETAETIGLLDWSKKHPDATFVYLWIECGGGDCVHSGFVFRDGTVIHVEPVTNGDCETREPLRRLLRHLGVELDARGFFEPLTRQYFGA